MKNLIIAVILMTVAINILYSQDKIDPLAIFKIDSSNFYVNRNPQRFILGWNWGSEGKALDDAIPINFKNFTNFQTPCFKPIETSLRPVST